MNHYIGVKEIHATPMNRADYNILRGWDLPADENGEDDGYLVEYLDGGQQNHSDYQGYISWSPKDVFERAYKATEGMTFGLALEALKRGAKVARKGWNGKGMWLSLSGDVNVSRYVEEGNFWSINNSDFAVSQGGRARVLPCITMKTADDAILMGWLASQTDMLSDDWEIVK